MTEGPGTIYVTEAETSTSSGRTGDGHALRDHHYGVEAPPNGARRRPSTALLARHGRPQVASRASARCDDVVLRPSPSARCCGSSARNGAGKSTLDQGSSTGATARTQGRVEGFDGARSTARRRAGPTARTVLTAIYQELDDGAELDRGPERVPRRAAASRDRSSARGVAARRTFRRAVGAKLGRDDRARTQRAASAVGG